MMRLKFIPGINREKTAYSAGQPPSPGWWFSDKIRFREGLPETIGGWVKAVQTTFSGICRALFQWSLLSGQQVVAVGTDVEVDILTPFGMYPITPIRLQLDGVDAENSMYGIDATGIMIINFPNNGAIAGDQVTIRDANGWPLLGPPASFVNGTHIVLDPAVVPGGIDPVNQIAVDLHVPIIYRFATSDPSGTTSTVVMLFANVADVSGVNIGWGSGGWGMNPWGEDSVDISPDSEVFTRNRIWTFDNYGQDLIFNYRGGPLYIWEPSFGYDVDSDGSIGRGVTIASQMGASDIPEHTYQVMVSSQYRIVMAFGTNPVGDSTVDPMLFRWSDMDNYLNWTPAIDNAAGDLRLIAGSYFVTALQTRKEILAWTDHALHSITFVGAPDVWGVDVVGHDLSIISPNAALATDDITVWMGTDGFYMYRGTVSPLPCSVKEYVLDRINMDQGWKVCVGYEPAFNEVKWFYPADNAEENTDYVSYNLITHEWAIGTLVRSAWAHRAYQQYSLGASTDGYLYAHEFGFNDGSTDPPSAINPVILSSPFELDGQNQLAGGETFFFISQMIPDISFRNSIAVAPVVSFTLIQTNQPGDIVYPASGEDLRVVGGQQVTTDASNHPFGTYPVPIGGWKTVNITVTPFTSLLYPRVRGRMCQLLVQSWQKDVAWRLGEPRILVRPDGKR